MALQQSLQKRREMIFLPPPVLVRQTYNEEENRRRTLEANKKRDLSWHTTDIRQFVRFHHKHTELKNHLLVQLPIEIECAVLLFRQHPFGTRWCIPLVIQFLAGKNYNRDPNIKKRMNYFYDCYTHTDLMSPRPPVPNPLIILLSNLVGVGCLPPDIFTSETILYNGDKMINVMRNFRFLLLVRHQLPTLNNHKRWFYCQHCLVVSPPEQLNCKWIFNFLLHIGTQLSSSHKERFQDFVYRILHTPDFIEPTKIIVNWFDKLLLE